MTKKIFAANIFPSFFDLHYFSMKLWQSSAFLYFVKFQWISIDGIWNKNKLSKILTTSKIVKLWIF